MSPKKSPKTSKPAPLFVLWRGTIRGPEVPMSSTEERIHRMFPPGAQATGPDTVYPALHVFSFGKVSQDECFPSLTDASRALCKEALKRGEGQGYLRGQEDARKEMLDRLTGKGDDYDD